MSKPFFTLTKLNIYDTTCSYLYLNILFENHLKPKCQRNLWKVSNDWRIDWNPTWQFGQVTCLSFFTTHSSGWGSSVIGLLESRFTFSSAVSKAWKKLWEKKNWTANEVHVHIINKKVLLRERKRHTARRVASPGDVDRQTDRHVWKHYLPVVLRTRAVKKTWLGMQCVSGTAMSGIGSPRSCFQSTTKLNRSAMYPQVS